MAGTAGTSKPSRASRLSLNSDGLPHPLLNVTSVLTLIVGLVSFALGMYLRYGTSSFGLAIAATVTGLVALVSGLIGQMMSATREERILLVVGMVAAFVGLALGLAHGGAS
jgi:hypothetical protein